jgi:RNA polymerase sigma-70 factor (ECF subfamily)
MSPEELTSLVLSAQSGEREAFNQLVHAFQARVYAIVLQRLRNTAEADEVAQDVFLRAFRKLPQLQDPDRFGGWLCQIAVRLSINRAVRRPAEALFEPTSFDGYDHTNGEPVDFLIRAEDMIEVRESLGRLGRIDRETLWAFYFEGSSLKEMSEQFDSPVGTIKRRLHTARGRLRELLAAVQPA